MEFPELGPYTKCHKHGVCRRGCVSSCQTGVELSESAADEWREKFWAEKSAPTKESTDAA